MFIQSSCLAVVIGNGRIISWGDHLSGKPGNGREFESCQGIDQNQGTVGRKILSGKTLLITLQYCTVVAVIFRYYTVSMHDVVTATRRRVPRSVREFHNTEEWSP